MLQGFRHEGLHWGLMRVRTFTSWSNRTISVKVSGYINGKQKGMGMHFPTDTQRGIQIYEGAGMQIQVSFLKYKQTLFYTHAYTTHTLSAQRATGYEAAL